MKNEIEIAARRNQNKKKIKELIDQIDSSIEKKRFEEARVYQAVRESLLNENEILNWVLNSQRQ